MTPDAVAALNKVAEAVEAHTAESSSLNATLLADQQEARDRENRRFKVVYRSLAALGVGLAVVLALLTVVVVQARTEAADRQERSDLAAAQRECSDTLVADVLVRVSIYATARGATDPVAIARLRERVAATRTDPSQLDELRDEVDTLLRAQPSDTNGLREDAAHSADRLLRVREICYRGTPPKDPLAS